MTVGQLSQTLDLKVLLMSDCDRAVQGAYAGDLLSWVMGNASEGNAFITIMSNVNVIAVASLIDMSCVIFCEGVQISQEIIQAAEQKQINLLSTSRSTYEMCAALHKVLA